MQMPLISIIVPVYKVELYLDRCIQSVIHQQYPNLEIILVNDGSPDSCPAMCDAWAGKDSRVKVVHKQNGGLSDARNAGLAIASGEYIAFVDSDDWVAPDFISAMYQAVQTTGADLAACEVWITDGNTPAPPASETAPLRVCSPEEAIGDILGGKGFRAVAWNKLYRRSLLEAETFPVGKYHEDEFFTYRILGKAGKLVFLNRPLYFYFQRQGSIMRSVSIRHLDALDAFAERVEYLRTHFPGLYVQDKTTFCFSCVSFYRDLAGQTHPDVPQMKRKIKACRKMIRFSPAELLGIPGKSLLYVLASGLSLDLFSKLLNLRKRTVASDG